MQKSTLLLQNRGHAEVLKNDPSSVKYVTRVRSPSVTECPPGSECKTTNGPVTLGSDYRTILKSDPILLISNLELDVPILNKDKLAVTLLRFIGADFIARKMRQWFVLWWSYDDRTMIASQKHCLATFQKSSLICEQHRTPVPTFFSRIRFCIWPKNRIRRSHDRWKNRVRPADFKIVR